VTKEKGFVGLAPVVDFGKGQAFTLTKLKETKNIWYL
jgi:hypothetical protein